MLVADGQTNRRMFGIHTRFQHFNGLKKLPFIFYSSLLKYRFVRSFCVQGANKI